MKNTSKKIIPAIAMLSVIVLLFSGCGAFTLISSVFNKNQPQNTDVPTDIVSENYDVAPDNGYDNSQYADNSQPVDTTSSYVVTPATTLAPAAPVTSASSGTSSKAPETTKAQTPQTTKQQPVTEAQKIVTPTEETTVPDIEDISQEEFNELSVHQIQNMLFDTEDPNVAGKILTLAGFAYDPEQCVYYSSLNPWQRFFGFNVIYDIAAPRVGMVYDTSRIYFDYDNRDWMIQIWKGQYGITAGAEVGLYNKPKDRLIPQYACAKDEDLITMKFDFYNGGKHEFTRGPEKHWWLTGFKVFHVGVSFMIDLDITLEFPNREMALAFEEGLKKAARQQLVDPMTYTRKGTTFNIKW